MRGPRAPTKIAASVAPRSAVMPSSTSASGRAAPPEPMPMLVRSAGNPRRSRRRRPVGDRAGSPRWPVPSVDVADRRDAQPGDRVAARDVVDPERREAESLDAGASRRERRRVGRSDESDRDRGTHRLSRRRPVGHVQAPYRRRGARRRRRRPWRPARSRRRVASAPPMETVPACQAGSPSAPSCGDDGCRGIGRDDREEPDAEVPGALGRSSVVPARSLSTRKTGAGDHVDAVELDPRAVGEHAREVRRDAAAGHVRERVHRAGVGPGEQLHERPGVQPGRLEERLAPGRRRGRRRHRCSRCPWPSRMCRTSE